ncbi:MAG: DUF1573 domain-containing protein [Planctomycetota bacterium]
MKRNQLFLIFAFLTFVHLLPIGGQESATVANSATMAELPATANRSTEHSPKLLQRPDMDEISLPRISFEKMVCDLGEVGQGTKNTCEFRFTNTGRGLLKIGKISRTCGCTVFKLDKKEYAPNETGTIKVSYTSGKSTGIKKLRKSASNFSSCSSW